MSGRTRTTRPASDYPVGYRPDRSRWTVTGPATTVHGERVYPCRCECGAERNIPAGEISRPGKVLMCRSCHLSHLAAEVVRDGRTRALTTHQWPKQCKTCRTKFLGTAKQQYCQRSCRPGRRTPPHGRLT